MQTSIQNTKTHTHRTEEETEQERFFVVENDGQTK